MTDEEVLKQIELVGHNLFGKPGRMTMGMYCSQNQGRLVAYGPYREWCRDHGPLPALQSFQPDVKRFIGLGMMSEIPPTGGFRVRLYRVNAHHLWVAFENILGVHLLAELGFPQAIMNPRIAVEAAVTNLRELEERFRP